MMKSFLMNKKIFLWVFIVAVSVLLIAPNPNPKGLVVTSVTKEAGARLAAGEVLYRINDADAGLADLQKEFAGLVKLETNKGVKFLRANGTLGVKAEGVPSTNLKFGLDLKGGVTATIKPEKDDPETIQQIISTLQTRINVYGLRETVFRPVFYQGRGFVEITIAGGNDAEFRSLIESQGNFEAKMPLILRLSQGKAKLQLSSEHEVSAAGGLTVDGREVGNNFTLDGIYFSVDGIGRTVNLTATVFSGSDVKIVFFDPQRSGVESGSFYRWFFQVQLSPEAANRFYWVARNMQTFVDPAAGERYLESKISFYLDGRLIDSLNVAGTFRDAPVTSPSISGGASSLQEAVDEKARLQSILRSGALPTKIEIVQLSSISPTLGSNFFKNALVAALAAVVSVFLIVLVRYRKPVIAVPMMVVVISEVTIVLGISSLFNIMKIGWTIDLPAIGGLIAAVGIGINDQIVIMDNVLRKEANGLSLAERLRKAFFVVFGAAGTIIAAMLPLMFSGFGALTGFALTTIIGTLVGVLITRPAFGVLVEKTVSKYSK